MGILHSFLVYMCKVVKSVTRYAIKYLEKCIYYCKPFIYAHQLRLPIYLSFFHFNLQSKTYYFPSIFVSLLRHPLIPFLIYSPICKIDPFQPMYIGYNKKEKEIIELRNDFKTETF